MFAILNEEYFALFAHVMFEKACIHLLMHFFLMLFLIFLFVIIILNSKWLHNLDIGPEKSLLL